MRRSALAGLLAFAMMTRPLHAQDQSQTTTASKAPSPEENAEARVHGSADVGYRFTDIDGSEATYRQLFNLFNGPRLFGLELHATGAPSSKIFDTFWLSASGIGDPFPTVQLTLRKSLFYDLRVNFQQSRFFDVTPLTPASIGGLDTQAVTNRHNWNTSKQIGNIAYTLYATNRLRFFFDYDRVANQGQLQSTRAIDFVGSPAAWGSFARANPYEVVGPVNNEANRVTGGVSYSRDHWTVHYRAGYQTYDETPEPRPADAQGAEHQRWRPGDRGGAAVGAVVAAEPTTDKPRERAVVRRPAIVANRVAWRIPRPSIPGAVQRGWGLPGVGPYELPPAPPSRPTMCR